MNGFPQQRIVSEQLPAALDRVREKYGVPVNELEALIQEQQKLSGPNGVDSKDASPLAFGNAVVPAGDLVRLDNSSPLTYPIPAFQKPSSKDLFQLPLPDRFNMRRPWLSAIHVSSDLNFWGETAHETIPLNQEQKVEALEFLLEAAHRKRGNEAKKALKRYETKFGPISFETQKSLNESETYFVLTDAYVEKLSKVPYPAAKPADEPGAMKEKAKSILDLITPKEICNAPTQPTTVEPVAPVPGQIWRVPFDPVYRIK